MQNKLFSLSFDLHRKIKLINFDGTLEVSKRKCTEFLKKFAACGRLPDSSDKLCPVYRAV